MKTVGTKYFLPDENSISSLENRATSFEDAMPEDMAFSYVFTMDGEELLQQKVYNYDKYQSNEVYQNSENDNNYSERDISDKDNFVHFQRDRLSSGASTVDEAGSDDFIINNDGETNFRRCLNSNSDTEQDCYIIEQIFPRDNSNNYKKYYNRNYENCVKRSNSKTNHDSDNRTILLELDKLHIPLDPQNSNLKNISTPVDENLLKIYRSDDGQNNGKPSKVNDVILTLFDNVSIIKPEDENSKGNEINYDYHKSAKQDRNFNYCSVNFQDNETEKTDNCNKNQKNQNDYFTKWFPESESSKKHSGQPQPTPELLMIDCDESVSSLTISDDSSYVISNNGFKGFKSYVNQNVMNSSQRNQTLIKNDNNNHSPLPPIETMLMRQGNRSTSFTSMIRKNSSSLHCHAKVRESEIGEFGHLNLNCGQKWQNDLSSVNDTNCNITDNQVIVSQCEGASVEAFSRITEDIPAGNSGLLECRWEDCWSLFQGQSALVRHIEKTHVELRRGEDFACLWQACPRRTRPFNARYKLLIHMRVHSGEKPNKCPFQGCLKAFSRLENLKIHQRSHTGERPYACQFQGCPKAFSNSSDRAKHQRTHFDTKPYACQVIGCNKRYTDPSSLRKHIKNHGGVSTGRTKKLVASEPIVSPNELITRQRYDSTSSVPSPALPESSPTMEVKNEPEISNEVTTITDLSDAMYEYIPYDSVYDSVHQLLDEDCIDPSSWEEEMSAEIEREFLSLTSDYNTSLMDVNEENCDDKNVYS